MPEEETTQGQEGIPVQTEPVVEPVQGTEESNGTGEVGSNNPAWAPILDVLPEALHHLVTPQLQEWDKGVQQRFESIKGQYKPWEDVISNVSDPELAFKGAQLLQALEANPEGFWRALGDSYNFTPAQQAAIEQAVASDDGEEELTIDPRITKLEDAVGKLAEMLLGERQQKQQQTFQEQLTSELTSLAKEHGEFDQEWVLTRIAAGDKPADAVAKYNKAINDRAAALSQKSVDAPSILGGSGGIPANQVNLKDLDSKGTKDLVVQMLKNASAGQ